MPACLACGNDCAWEAKACPKCGKPNDNSLVFWFLRPLLGLSDERLTFILRIVLFLPFFPVIVWRLIDNRYADSNSNWWFIFGRLLWFRISTAMLWAWGCSYIIYLIVGGR